MATKFVHPDRIHPLNDEAEQGGDYVLYWMQQSQRAEHNDALEYALQQANERALPLLVGFGLMDDYPEANLRHYRFMLEGLVDAQQTLANRGIRMIVRHGSPAEVALELGRAAPLIVCDRGYLRHQKRWRNRVADEAGRPVVQVEADVVVPVDVVSDKPEYAARTIRPKINTKRAEYLVELRETKVTRDSLSLNVAGMDLSNVDEALNHLRLDRSVPPNPRFVGGTTEARRLLRTFIRDKLDHYAAHRNKPETNDVSHMSKYLHFGHVSPVYLALHVRDAHAGTDDDRASYLEEMIVRRELAQNFCEFTPDYDRYSCLPDWARKTLDHHRDDPREHIYTKQQLEDARTHDAYWNAAMREMRYTGYVHNHMRMYWGKKILQWTNTPEYAHQIALELNNKYFIDGRDANSFANVNWCFGLHDRAFAERDVFGKVRYLAASGLERKCKPRQYVEKVDRLVEQAENPATAAT